MLKLAEPPARLGLALHKDEQELDWDLFSQAGLRLVQQNKARFHDQKEKMAHILQREKVSLQTKMRQIWRYVTSKSRVFFNEIFPLAKTSRLERLTAFLALLEMMRLNRILVRQDRPFDVIMLEENKLAGGDAARIEQDLLAAVKEKEYD
jgi:segregation and condensation protein A